MVRLTRICRTLMVMAPLSLVDLVSLLSASAFPPPLPPAFLEEDLSALLLPLVSPFAGLESLDLAMARVWMDILVSVKRVGRLRGGDL